MKKIFLITIGIILVSTSGFAQGTAISPGSARVGSASALTGAEAEIQRTQEIPPQQYHYAVPAWNFSAGETKTSYMVEIGENRYFSVYFNFVTVTGSPDFDVNLLGSFDKDPTHLSVPLNGTIVVLDDYTTADTWEYKAITPAPARYVAFEVICNSGSGDTQVNLVVYRTGS